ncbi:MAG: hypothetical protein WC044_02905 [Crocinitomicaceae bacterium]
MKRIGYVATLILILLSCKDQANEKPLSMEDIVAHSDKYKENDTPVKESKTFFFYDSLSPIAQRIVDTLSLMKESILLSDSLLPPDRFLFSSKEKWTGRSQESTILISQWKYKDSLQTKNAFFNWLDCFGKSCASLRLFEEKKLSKESFLFFILERRMIYVSTSAKMDAKKMIESLAVTFPKDRILYVISQSVGRKTEWWTFVDEEWTLKKEGI